MRSGSEFLLLGNGVLEIGRRLQACEKDRSAALITHWVRTTEVE